MTEPSDHKPPTTAPTTKEDKAKALGECYTAATRRLREAHLAEFNGYRAEEAKARGIEWTPQPTAAEKAAAEIERLLADNPGLAQALGIVEAEPTVVPA